MQEMDVLFTTVERHNNMTVEQMEVSVFIYIHFPLSFARHLQITKTSNEDARSLQLCDVLVNGMLTFL